MLLCEVKGLVGLSLNDPNPRRTLDVMFESALTVECVCVCVCVCTRVQWRRKAFSYWGAGAASKDGREVLLSAQDSFSWHFG